MTMNRRGGPGMQAIAIIAVVGLFTYGIYSYHGIQTRLRTSDEKADRLHQQHDSISAQLQVVYEHKTRIERSLQDEKQAHSKTKEEYRVQKNDMESKFETEKQDLLGRINSINQEHRMLEGRHTDLEAEFSKLQADYDKAVDDHKQISVQHQQEYDLLKQEKDNEVAQLNDQIADLNRRNLELQESLQQAQQAAAGNQQQLLSSQAELQDLRTNLARLKQANQLLQNQQQAIQQKPQAQEPMGQQPVEKQPIERQPIGQQPIGGQPIGGQPIGGQPLERQPIERQPIGQQLNIRQPIIQQPIGQELNIRQPIGQQPIGQQQNIRQPIGQQLNIHQPMGQQPLEQPNIGQQHNIRQPIGQQAIDQNAFAHHPQLAGDQQPLGFNQRHLPRDGGFDAPNMVQMNQEKPAQPQPPQQPDEEEEEEVMQVPVPGGDDKKPYFEPKEAKPDEHGVQIQKDVADDDTAHEDMEEGAQHQVAAPNVQNQEEEIREKLLADDKNEDAMVDRFQAGEQQQLGQGGDLQLDPPVVAKPKDLPDNPADNEDGADQDDGRVEKQEDGLPRRGQDMYQDGDDDRDAVDHGQQPVQHNRGEKDQDPNGFYQEDEEEDEEEEEADQGL